jgi:hypothetical protein
MTSAVLHLRTQLGISSPFNMGRDIDTRENPISSSSKPSETVVNPDAQPKTFKRFRSSLEQSIRAATRTRSNKHSTSSVSADANGLSTTSTTVPKEKGSLLVRADSKVKTKVLPKVSFKLMTRDGAGSSVTGNHCRLGNLGLPAI